MKRLFATTLIFATLDLSATEIKLVPTTPQAKYEMEDSLPAFSQVFTLPAPSKILLPVPVKKAIMFYVKLDPSKETVRRDEYSNVKDNLDDLCSWLLEGFNSQAMQIYRYFVNTSWTTHSNGGDENLILQTSDGLTKLRKVDLLAWKEYEQKRIETTSAANTVTTVKSAKRSLNHPQTINKP